MSGIESSAGTQAQRRNGWRACWFDSPKLALYGAQKVMETKLAMLTTVLDIYELKLYDRCVALLVRVVALCIVHLTTL
jgi:hypothetical protein